MRLEKTVPSTTYLWWDCLHLRWQSSALFLHVQFGLSFVFLCLIFCLRADISLSMYPVFGIRYTAYRHIQFGRGLYSPSPHYLSVLWSVDSLTHISPGISWARWYTTCILLAAGEQYIPIFLGNPPRILTHTCFLLGRQSRRVLAGVGDEERL